MFYHMVFKIVTSHDLRTDLAAIDVFGMGAGGAAAPPGVLD